MSGITKTRLDRLVTTERSEIEAILAAARGVGGTARFVSDEADTMVWYLFLAVCAVCGIVGFFVVEDLAAVSRFWSYFVTDLPTSAVYAIQGSPQTLGFQVAIVVAVWVVLTFLRVHRRHGWMATTFALVRIRGSRVLAIRYRDMARVEKRIIRGRNSFSLIDLTTTDGLRKTCYSGRIFDAVKVNVPLTTVVISPDGHGVPAVSGGSSK